MRRFITIFYIAVSVLIPARGQSVPQALTEAITQGNADQMADFFHQSLEMTILNKDYMVSKSQATRIMEDFFREHPPSGFTISFEGAKEKSKYAIGSLSTPDGKFRVNLFFMNKGNARLIYYLSIEKESEYELYPRP